MLQPNSNLAGYPHRAGRTLGKRIAARYRTAERHQAIDRRSRSSNVSNDNDLRTTKLISNCLKRFRFRQRDQFAIVPH
jgi:hypothetical protein